MKDYSDSKFVTYPVGTVLEYVGEEGYGYKKGMRATIEVGESYWCKDTWRIARADKPAGMTDGLRNRPLYLRLWPFLVCASEANAITWEEATEICGRVARWKKRSETPAKQGEKRVTKESQKLKR